MSDLRDAYDAWHKETPTGSVRTPWYQLVVQSLGDTLNGSSVLEIGCGGGEFSAWMADHGARSVIGEDFASEPIRAATLHHQRSNLEFAIGDIQDIAHPDGTFDLVVSCATIEHVPSPRQAISELGRVLRPGGTLFLTFPNYLSLTGIWRLYRTATGRKFDEGGQPLVNWIVYPGTARWIRQAGLSIEATSGDGWYIPVPGRSGGIGLQLGPKSREWLKPIAFHILMRAQKARTK